MTLTYKQTYLSTWIISEKKFIEKTKKCRKQMKFI